MKTAVNPSRMGICAWALVLILFIPPSLSTTVHAATAKPFKRVLYMHGWGFDFAVFFGIYQAMVDAGQAPDLIVGACGGGVAAGMIAAHPDLAELKKFAKGPELHSLISDIKPKKGGNLLYAFSVQQKIASSFRAAKKHPAFAAAWIADASISRPDPETLEFVVPKIITSRTIMDAPNETGMPKFLGTLPDPQPGQPHVAILTTQILFNPEEQGKPRKGPLYQGVILTRKEDALLLKDSIETSLETRLSSSTFAKKVITRDDFGLYSSARATISDPFFFEPYTHSDGTRYTTGVGFGYPLDWLKTVADEVWAVTPIPLPTPFDTQPMGATFFIEQKNPEIVAGKDPSVNWINVDLDRADARSFNPALSFGFFRVTLDKMWPDTYDKSFKRMVSAQWRAGYMATQETLHKRARPR